ncbi:MAG: RHS repeat-associated core domain-containing protein [Bacteroidota bacterium]
MNTEKTPVNWYFHGARYFDPQLATWHSPDPLSESSTSLSPYTYVANNPVNFVDPNGMLYAKPSDWEREQAKEGAYCSEIWWKMARMMGRPEFYSGADAYFSQDKWSYNWSTGRYENSYSGESFSATEYASAEALAYMGIDFDYYDFASFYSDMASRNNGEDFYITLEFGYDKLWVVGNSKITGDPSLYGGVTSSNYQSYGEAKITYASSPGGTWDPITNERISQLHPDVQGPAINFINQVGSDLGIKLRVTQGLRSFAEQDALYAKGRTAPGSIVTNAKGGQSYHNYGLALDVVEIRNGKAIWNTNWSGISRIGINNGFEWGGNFRSISDKPHFQMTFGYSISDLLNLYNTGQW